MSSNVCHAGGIGSAAAHLEAHANLEIVHSSETVVACAWDGGAVGHHAHLQGSYRLRVCGLPEFPRVSKLAAWFALTVRPPLTLIPMLFGVLSKTVNLAICAKHGCLRHVSGW